MKISWVMLTYDRALTTTRSSRYNESNSGFDIHELIWVDNGSDYEEWQTLQCEFSYDVHVKHAENLGVAKGYNHGIAMATGDYVLITGCDRLMPKDWLRRMVDKFLFYPDCGVVSLYSKPKSQVPERFIGEQALPMEARLVSRKLLQTRIGYFREDFGLYGHEDVEWAHRAMRVCNERGLKCYNLEDMTAEHLGNEGVDPYNGRDDKEYHAFKAREAADPAKHALLEKCRAENYPYYNPYA